MSEYRERIKEVERRIREHDMRDLIGRLVPGLHVPRKGNIRSPFRPDGNPSISVYTPRREPDVQYWKDHGSNDGGDNIEFYLRLRPELDYDEAIDDLAMLLFGCSAHYDASESAACPVVRALSVPLPRLAPVPRADVLQIVEDLSLDEAPVHLREYWRSRGIDDSVMVRLGCRYVVYRNTNQVGTPVMDRESGLPVVDEDGNPLLSDGLHQAIGMPNDIGAYSMRTPDTAAGKGFKCSNRSFISTFLSDCGRPNPPLVLQGGGDDTVCQPRYSDADWRLYINPAQWYYPVSHRAAPFAITFLSSFGDRPLSVDDRVRIGAVLSELNVDPKADVVIVEGMFDGLSIGEIDRVQGRLGQGRDIVVLNGVGNVKWAVPFLCRHDEIHLMLDNDLRSGAGQTAASELRALISEFCECMNIRRVVVDDSVRIKGCKDVNEWLVRTKNGGPHM